MKLTTWNCNSHPSIKTFEKAAQAFDTKINLLAPLQSEIVILQEIARPSNPISPQAIWHGDSLSRGIAVITNKDYNIEVLPECPPTRSALPLRVSGKRDFNLLAIWSHPIKTGIQDYVHEVISQVEVFSAFLKSAASVIAGDFNSNAIWNNSGKHRNHSFLVDLLEREFNLKSCYHNYFETQHGKEEHPTIYWMKKADKTYHIDYCFIPKDWKIKSVTVGSHSDWIKASDHCPLSVEIE